MGLAKAFHTLFLPLAMLLFPIGLLTHDLNVLYAAMALLFIVNVAYAIENLSSRSVFLFFHLGIFLFLVSRPTIHLLRGGASLTDLSMNFASAEFSLVVIFITLLCLRLGSMVAERLQRNSDAKAEDAKRGRLAAFHPNWLCNFASKRPRDTRDNPILPTLRMASFLIYVLGFIGLMWLGATKLQAMQGLSYEHFYTVNISQYTSLFQRTMATMEPYALCAFLATFPKKRAATAVLLMHMVTTVPILIIGSRADFVLGALFLLLYYILRDHSDGKGSWIGRFERVLVAICLPVGIIAMGLVSVLRANEQIVNFSLFDSLVTAVYQQGVTYEVLSKGFYSQGMIAEMGFKGYSFGALTDYILHGPFGVYILGNPDLGTSNSIQLAVQGHSYPHAMSYFMHWWYLQGEGWGSSYLLELNQDFGLLGVGIFSFFFGMILNYLPRLLKRSWLWGTLTLTICIVLFHMPRGSAIEWISYIWTLQFWFTLGLIVGLAWLMRSKRFREFATASRNRLVGRPLQPLRKVMSTDHEYGNLRGFMGNHQAPDCSHPADHVGLRWLGGSAGLTKVRAGAYHHLYR